MSGGDNMTDDVIHIILCKLDKIDAKQDAQAAQLTQISERLAAMEEKQRQQEKINAEVDSLHELKNKGMGARAVVAWLVTTSIALAALFRSHF